MDKPLWTPNADFVANSRLNAFKQKAEAVAGRAFADYEALHAWSVEDLEGFWGLAWDFFEIIGDKGGCVLERGDVMAATAPRAEFFPDARLNFAENLLRRRDGADAIVFQGEDKVSYRLSYRELYERVSQLAQFFKSVGVRAGDRVAGLVSHMPEAVIGHLAAASIGAIWSSASPDFGVQGVIDRFGQIKPKVLIAVNGYYYNGKIIDCMPKLVDIQKGLDGLEHTLIVPYLDSGAGLGGLDNARLLSDVWGVYAPVEMEFERFGFNHPLVIMFSSGTTGVPKCIVHGAGGTLIQQMKEHQLQCDVKWDDRVFYFTTCGWMMWNWQIAALASGATLLTYDGSPFYPDANVLWDYTERERASLFGTGAKYIDALKKQDVCPKGTHKLEHLRTLTSTGSPLVHESFDYVYENIKADLHLASISGGIDIISCFVLGNPISPVWRGEIQCAGLGMAIEVFDDNGQVIPAGAGQGELVCVRPFPSMPVAFWNDEGGQKYNEAYFSGYHNVWQHGDWIERTIHAGWVIHGRSDATLKPGGVRIGTAEIYRQVEQVEEVLESLAVGQHWENDERIVLFVRLREGVMLDEALVQVIKQRIRQGATPRHVPAVVLAVPDIPRTKSNKIVEIAVRNILHGRKVRNVEALANPESLEFYESLAKGPLKSAA